MSTRTASVILHGFEWPDPTWIQELRAVLAVPPGAGSASVIEVLEARESPGHLSGAAAAINRTADHASGDLLIVIEAGCAWEKRLLADLGTAVANADVLAVAAPGPAAGTTASGPRPEGTWNDAWVPAALPPQIDLTVLIEQASLIPLEQWTAQLHAARPRLWAIRRATFRSLGGLDPAFWSIGVVEDLAGRATARGIPVRLSNAAASSESSHDAWPLRPHVRQLLGIRNALLSASRMPDSRHAGRAFGVVAALAFGEAWRQARIGAERLRFGGRWGARRGFLQRRTMKTGPSTAPQAEAVNPSDDELWPASDTGTLLPVLALDAFLDVLVARANDPARTWTSPPPAPHVESPDAVSDDAFEASNGSDVTRAGTTIPVTAPVIPVLPGDGSQPSPESHPPNPPAPDDRPLPQVSVIVVNWNGRGHLEPCFSSLIASDYPADRLEILCVDNGSTDGSREHLATRFPQVRIIALPDNRGFTGGNNAGVAAARGDVLVFFNNDMRIASGTVRALVAALDEEHPCAAAEVRSWNGRSIDFVRGSVNFEAHGFQDHYGEAWRPDRAAAAETFFPNGGAFAVTRDAYFDAGGFDEDFFAYYDDVDLGYGLRLNGGRIRMVHGALVYHRHGATSRRYPTGQKRFLMERNAIWTVLKRYEAASLDRTFGAVLLLAARRIAQETVLRRRFPWVQSLALFTSRCRKRPTSQPSLPASQLYEPVASRTVGEPALHEDIRARVIDSMPVESLAAVGEALRGLPQVLAKRRESEARRVVPDRMVFAGMGRPLAYGSPLASYQAAHDALVEALRLANVFRSRPRLLIITHEPLRKRMSGPGVRVFELGRAVASSVRVTIATPAEPEIADPRCSIVSYSPERPSMLRRLAEDADVLMVQGFALTQFPFLTAMHVPIIVDLYCPFTIEHLEMKTAEAHARGAAAPDVDVQLEAIGVLEVQNAQLRHGDFFLCASERQRDFWLGALHSAGRLNAQTYAADGSLRNLIGLVPFGVPEEDFAPAAVAARTRAGGPVLKGARAGIKPGDRVLFWGGSLLDWQDPLTLIRAVSRLAHSRPDVKLFFAGTRHPNPQVAPMQVVDASMTLARDLGVLDTHVFFNDWVPYDERAAYLLESDLGLSTHRLHLETHLSFRTRMLDYIWAALPIVCTEGDYFADLVQSHGLGLVVPQEDDQALAAAIARLLDDRDLAEACRGHLRGLREELRWHRVAEPLRQFAGAPRFAADREPAVRAIRSKLRQGYRASKWIKRTALRFGVSESGFELLKSLPPVRAAVHMRNRLALSRAGRLR